ncbi:hypothetical protein [Pseudaeromonas pectinilytica]
MNLIYWHEYLVRPFKEFQRLSAKGNIVEANLYIAAILRELEELHKAQHVFALTAELHKTDPLIIDGISRAIHDLLKNIMTISDLLAIECEIVLLDVAAGCIRKCSDLTEITQQLSAVRDLRMQQLQAHNKDFADGADDELWNNFVIKAKSWNYVRLH